MNAHWILQLRRPEGKEEFTNASFHCSNCYCIPIDTTNRRYPVCEHYCHKCGAHMIEEPTIKVEEYNDDEAIYKWE